MASDSLWESALSDNVNAQEFPFQTQIPFICIVERIVNNWFVPLQQGQEEDLAATIQSFAQSCITPLTICMWCEFGVCPQLALCFSEYSHVFLPSNEMNENNAIFSRTIIACHKLSMRAVMQSCSILLYKMRRWHTARMTDTHENTFSQTDKGELWPARQLEPARARVKQEMHSWLCQSNGIQLKWMRDGVNICRHGRKCGCAFIRKSSWDYSSLPCCPFKRNWT